MDTIEKLELIILHFYHFWATLYIADIRPTSLEAAFCSLFTLYTYAQLEHTKKGKKVKVRIALYALETHHRATERHPPYGITQCYLPPDTGERAPP